MNEYTQCKCQHDGSKLISPCGLHSNWAQELVNKAIADIVEERDGLIKLCGTIRQCVLAEKEAKHG